MDFKAFLELAKSPNAKIIISDGDMPMLMGEDSSVKPVVPSRTSNPPRGGQ